MMQCQEQIVPGSGLEPLIQGFLHYWKKTGSLEQAFRPQGRAWFRQEFRSHLVGV